MHEAEIDESQSTRPARALAARVLTWLRNTIAVLVLCAVAGVVVLELFAWLLPQDFRVKTAGRYRDATCVAFFARVFQLQFGLGVGLAFLVVLLTGWWRSALVVLACALLLLAPFGREYLPKSHAPVAGPTMRVLSMNLFFMNHDADAIMRAINDADPDVIVMAEVTGWSRAVVINGALSGRYPYQDFPAADGAAVVLSRVPFKRDKPVVDVSDPRARVPLVFTLGGRELTLYGVHLVSPGHRWLVEHNREQTQVFARILAAESRPVVISGDFNFTQLSPNYRYLHSFGMRSSADLAGFGVGNTWGPKWSWMNNLPGMRIDHILMTPQLTATSHRVGLDDGSDHRPIVADIGFVATVSAQ